MSKRIPGMYYFYFNAITKALHEENYEEVDRLVADTPNDIKRALIRNEVIEGSVEQSRELTTEEAVRATIIALNQMGYLPDKAWPSYSEQERIYEEVVDNG